MNDLDELLQERLAQLEAGEPLSAARADMPEETAAALSLAAALRGFNLPEPDETAVISQRAAVLRAAQQQAAANTTASESTAPGWLTVLQSWWRGHRAVAWGFAAFAAVLLLVFAASLLLRGNDEPETAVIEQQADDRPEQTEEATGSSLLDRIFGGGEPEITETAPGESETADSAETPGEVAAVEQSDLGFQTYLPFMVDPLAVGPKTAVLGDFHGMVSVQQPDGSWQQVNVLTSLAAGSRVRTGALSKASLTFFDGSVAKLGPDSELSIDNLNALRPEDGFRTVVLTQWRGDSIHDVQFRNDNGSRYEVLTPTGSGIARGTTFMVTVLANLTSRYTVLEGRVDVTSINVTVTVLAGQLSTVEEASPPTTPVFQVSGEGEVTQVGETWIIGGQTFATTAQTVIVGNPQVGDWVTVQGHLLSDGTKVADQIVLVREVPQNLFTLTAVVTEMAAETWQLGNVTILLDGETAVEPDIEVGDSVRVTGIIQPDGSLLARRIQKQSPEGEPFEFTGVVQEIGAEVWLISGIQVAVNGRTEIKNDPEVGDVVKVEGQITPEGVWLAREIKADDDDDTTFEFTGLVETIDPWLVAGIGLVTDEWTEIEAGIEPGDQVKVEGVILPDGTWLAVEIKRVETHSPNEVTLRFTGIVESKGPWVVGGISLVQTAESHIAEGVVVGSLVQVTARLTVDGTWEIVWIRPLLPPTTGCFTLHTLITSVNGSQIVLANWPTLTINNSTQVEGELAPNSIIALSICLNPDGTVIVVNIIVIQIVVNSAPPAGEGNNNEGNGGNGRVTICHKGNTLTISQSGLNGHLGHGDSLGACGQGGGGHHGNGGDDDDDDDDDDD